MFNGSSVVYVFPWKVTMENITRLAAVCHHTTLIVCCAECTFFSFGGSERINFSLIRCLEHREGFSNQLEEKSGNPYVGFE